MNMKTLIYFSFFLCVNSFSQSFGGIGGIGGIGGGSIDIDHDPIQRQSVEMYHLPVAECRIIRDKEYILNKVNAGHEEIFDLAKQTRLGSELVSDIKQLLQEKKLLIKELNYPERIKRKLSPKTSALYDVTEKIPTIYLDPKHELGLVVHFFVHEATHALDSLIIEEYRRDLLLYDDYKKVYDLLGLSKNPYKILSDEETVQISYVWEKKEESMARHAYRAERYAFDRQGEFTKEILSSNDCYKKYVDDHRKVNGLKLYEYTSDDFIYGAYNINKKYLNK